MPNSVQDALAVITAYIQTASQTQAPEMLSEYGDLLTPDDISALTGMHPETIRTLIKSGELKGCRMGQRYYVSKPNFIGYLNGGGLND